MRDVNDQHGEAADEEFPHSSDHAIPLATQPSDGRAKWQVFSTFGMHQLIIL